MFISYQTLIYFEVFWNTCMYLSSLISKTLSLETHSHSVWRGEAKTIQEVSCELPQHPINSYFWGREASEAKLL